eukprot:CAMPEP_0183522858 /NCGR_PEP_ID=MMETSP0371-20130417/18748_1 /TAXON_ID=268820 /ORGANISM="Peridinium aciculiferum, Strain PAER-2" /LENGTH=65 /DNA_ID=CAMNT_0025721697 /DNA_START=21 /DNA_END=215 /DNA_ORIENTATION=-
MDDSQVAKVIVKFPTLLGGYSLENNMQPKVQSLRDHGFVDSQIVGALARFPQLLSYSSKRLEHRT